MKEKLGQHWIAFTSRRDGEEHVKSWLDPRLLTYHPLAAVYCRSIGHKWITPELAKLIDEEQKLDTFQARIATSKGAGEFLMWLRKNAPIRSVFIPSRIWTPVWMSEFARKLLESLAKQYEKNHRLSEKQWALLGKTLPNYWVNRMAEPFDLAYLAKEYMDRIG